MKKIHHNRAKKFTFIRRFDGFWNIEKSNRKACFQMARNARKSCANSFLKIKPMIIELDFREINKIVKNLTAIPRNSSLCIYQRNVEILSVNIKVRLTLCKDYNISSFCHNPTP